MKKTQEQWVKERLRSTGEVSRNGALQNYISRLGAIICNLNKEGWNISGAFSKTENSKDFVYTLISAPQKPTITYKETPEGRVAVYQS